MAASILVKHLSTNFLSWSYAKVLSKVDVILFLKKTGRQKRAKQDIRIS